MSKVESVRTNNKYKPMGTGVQTIDSIIRCSVVSHYSINIFIYLQYYNLIAVFL